MTVGTEEPAEARSVNEPVGAAGMVMGVAAVPVDVVFTVPSVVQVEPFCH